MTSFGVGLCNSLSSGRCVCVSRCTSESSGLSPIHEEQSAEGPVVADEAEAENTWQNPTTNRGKKARKNEKKRKNESVYASLE